MTDCLNCNTAKSNSTNTLNLKLDYKSGYGFDSPQGAEVFSLAEGSRIGRISSYKSAFKLGFGLESLRQDNIYSGVVQRGPSSNCGLNGDCRHEKSQRLGEMIRMNRSKQLSENLAAIYGDNGIRWGKVRIQLISREECGKNAKWCVAIRPDHEKPFSIEGNGKIQPAEELGSGLVELLRKPLERVLDTYGAEQFSKVSRHIGKVWQALKDGASSVFGF